ncbi:MAG: hypothetical protein AAB215_09605, partial [Planctomycetota bacterium]
MGFPSRRAFLLAVGLFALAGATGAPAAGAPAMRYASQRLEGDYDLDVRLRVEDPAAEARIALHHEGDREIVVSLSGGKARMLAREGGREREIAAGTFSPAKGDMPLSIFRRG